jgi:hypothetical protein
MIKEDGLQNSEMEIMRKEKVNVKKNFRIVQTLYHFMAIIDGMYD